MHHPQTGRDGRELITTAQAAYSRALTPSSFRKWAQRHGITAAAYRPTGNSGHPEALWDPADITDAITTAGRLTNPLIT